MYLYIAIILFFMSAANAETILVSIDGTNGENCGVSTNPNCRTISYAVNSRAQAGDTVQVGAGLFVERVVIGQSGSSGSPITIQGTRGSGGEWLTKIDGSVPVPSTGWSRWSSDSGSIRYLTWVHTSLDEDILGNTEPWAMVTSSYEKIPKCYNSGSYPATPILEASQTADIVESGYENVADYFEGIGAVFAFMDDNTYVRFKNGENPGTVGARIAPAGGVFDLGGRSYITVKDFEIVGGQFGARIDGGSNNRIENNKIMNGYARVRIEGGASNNTIIGNTMLSNHIGPYTQRAYMNDFQGHPLGYAMAVSRHLYDQYKHGLQGAWTTSPSGDSAIQLYDDGENNKILYNIITETQAGVFINNDTANLQDELDIGYNDFSYIKDAFSRATNTKAYIHDNTFNDLAWLFRMNEPEPPTEMYIYRNKYYSPAGYCAVWWSEEGNGGATVWFYHNTCVIDDGGDYGPDDNSSALNFGWGSGPVAINGYFINNIFSTKDTTEGYSPGFLEAYDYNISANGDIPDGDSSDGIGSNNVVLSSGDYVWDPSESVLTQNFIPPGAISWEERGIDVSQPFNLVSGGPYGPLPGYAPGTPGAVSLPYFDGSAPDIGAVQSNQSTAPVISITSPSTGSVYVAPADVPVSASASDTDGIASVQFFYNGTSSGIDTTSPYQVIIEDLIAGSYTLTALATDMLGTSSTSAPVLITVSSTPVGTQVSVNAGGPAVAPFIADTYYQGGLTIARTVTIDTSAANSAPMAVYQDERYGDTANVTYPNRFTYTIPGFSPSQSATVRLHFSENYFTAANRRLFDVRINGTTVLDEFDIYLAAGAANRAVIRDFTTTTNAQGQVVIEFLPGALNRPKVDGIEVIAQQDTDAPPNLIVSTPPTGSTVSGNVTISGTASDDNAVTSVTVSIDGGAAQTATGTTSWSYVLDSATLQDGIHTVAVRAWDATSQYDQETITLNVLNQPGTSYNLYQMREEVITNTTSYSNKFADTELRLTVTPPIGRTVNGQTLDQPFTWYGFHDGDGSGGQVGNIWKFRLLFDAPGVWTVSAGFYVPGTSTLNGPAISPYTYSVSSTPLAEQHGHVYVDEVTNQYVHADGTLWVPVVARTSNLIGTSQTLAEEWINEHGLLGVNAFGIAYKHDDFAHFLNTSGSRADPCTDTLDYTRMDVATWHGNDAILAYAQSHGVKLHVWNGISGVNTQSCGYGPQDFINSNTALGPNQVRFARYFLARWAPLTTWWHWAIDYEWQETGSTADEKNIAYAEFFEANNPWHTIITTHPTGGCLAWALGTGSEWDIVTAQCRISESDPVTSSLSAINTSDDFGMPVYNSEGVWTSDDTDRRLQTTEVRLGFMTHIMSNAASMYSSDWPSEGGTGCGDDESRNAIWDCVDNSTEYQSDISTVGAINQFFNGTVDIHGATTSALATKTGGDHIQTLAKTGEMYIIYVDEGATQVSLNLTGVSGTFNVKRYAASNLSSPTTLSDVSGGASVNLGATPSTGYGNDYLFVVTKTAVTLPSVLIANATAVTEGGQLSYVVTRSVADANPLTVVYTLSGTATGGSDYTIPSPLSVTIPANQATASVIISTTDDAIDEPAETLTVTLASGTGYIVGSPSSGSGSINDNDEPLPVVTIGNAASVVEGGTLMYPVSLNVQAPVNTTIGIMLSGIATPGSDYTLPNPLSVTIGQGSASANLPIITIDDTAYEPSEDVQVTLVAGAGYTIGSPNSGIGIIQASDEPLPVVTISNSADVDEGGVLDYEVTRSVVTDSALTVTFALSGTAGETDYAAPNPTSVTIPANVASQHVSIPTVDDTSQESDETVVVTLTAGSGYQLGTAIIGTGTILDNDTTCEPCPDCIIDLMIHVQCVNGVCSAQIQ